MRTIYFLSFLFIILIFNTNLNSTNKVQASFQYAVFNSHTEGPFVETYLTVLGNTSTFILNENKKYQSSIEITYIFKQEGKVINFSKNIILSPEIEDTLDIKPNFIDQQRFSIPNGIYNLELTIKDLGIESNSFSFNDILTINMSEKEINFSGVQFIEQYNETTTPNILSKNGYDLVPYVANYFPSNMNTIIFYTEIYNIKTAISPDPEVLIRYFIQKSNNNIALEEYNRIKKQKAENVNVLFSSFDISNLPSGNYDLIIEIKDKNNKALKTQKVFFQRSNPEKDINLEDIESININEVFTNKYKSLDTIQEYYRSIRPIANDVEKRFIDNQVKSTSLEYLQQYFYSFWAKRNIVNPEQEWEFYKKQVELVNNLYASQVTKGYESDRGWVFLQYGAPNYVSECKHESATYPYEIWHYYQIGENETKQVNVKFAFYNPDIAGNNYILINSNARGEMADRNWVRKLYRPSNNQDYKDQIESDEVWGTKALELWNQ